MRKIYPREFYLRQLRPFYDSDLIKVITGIRRCGKSCIMQSVALELKNSSVAEKDIIFLNLDKRGFKNITTSDALEKVIEEAVLQNGTRREHPEAYPFLYRMKFV